MTGTQPSTETERKLPPAFWWSLAMAFVSMFATSVFAVVYADYAVDHSNQSMCKLIQPIDVRQKQIQHPTKDQQDFEQRMAQLLREYRCKES